MRDQLIGYVLGALDAPEIADVEKQLSQDAALREELNLLQRAVGLLEYDRNHHQPPSGLAMATCRRVASLRVAVVPPSARAAAITAGAPRTNSRTVFGWNLIDLAVAAGIVIAAGMLLIPAVNHSRFNAQLANCQNNLGKIGRGLGVYSMKHEGAFPTIPASGKLSAAGIYAPKLIESGDVLDPRVFRCSLSDSDRPQAAKIPTMNELESASDGQLNEMLGRAGGSYGYTLGHRQNGTYCPTSYRGRTNFPIMADSPCESLDFHQSRNHGGLGQNVLFEDGHVRYLTSSHQPEGLSDPDFFRNNDGQIAAGNDAEDAVIGCSTARPQKN